MTKLDSLKTLKAAVEKEEVVLAEAKYSTEDGCNCLIGHLLKQGGMTEVQLKTLDDNSVNPYKWIGITKIMQRINEGRVEVKDDFVGPVLKNLGFDIENKEDMDLLGDLQYVNDYFGKDTVLSALTNKIEQLESAG